MWTTLPQWTVMSAEELDALPVGTRRTVEFVPGVFVTLAKGDDGWGLLARYRIYSGAIAHLRSAPRVHIDPEAEQV